MDTHDQLANRIRGLSRLTPAEARIADYFQRHRSSLAFETATSISRQTGLSKATVVRFISRLGYHGFADFQEHLKNEFLERLESPIKRYAGKKERQGREDHLRESIASGIRNLRELRERNSPTLIREVAEILAGDRGNLYVTGMLTSFGLAHVFWMLANYVRAGVVLLDNRASALPNQLVNATDEDILLAVTHRRYARQTDLAVNRFADLGATVVLLTDSDLNPISALADHVLVAPSDGPHLFDTNCAALTMIETLIAAMADQLGVDIHDRFQAMDDLYGYFEAFSPGLDYTLEQRARKRRGDRR